MDLMLSGRQPAGRAVYLTLISALVLPLGCFAATWPASAEDMKAPTAAELKNPEWIKEGRAHFVQACSYCHGEEGDAGKTGPFREHTGWDPQDIHDTISEGKEEGANVMPSWKDSISDPEIWKLVAFIHSLEGQKRAPE